MFTPTVAVNTHTYIRSASLFSPILSPPHPPVVLACERAEERANPHSPAQLNAPAVLVPPTPLTFQVRPPIALHTLTAPPDNRQSRLPLRSHSLFVLPTTARSPNSLQPALFRSPARTHLSARLGPSHHIPPSSSPSPSPSAPSRNSPHSLCTFLPPMPIHLRSTHPSPRHPALSWFLLPAHQWRAASRHPATSLRHSIQSFLTSLPIPTCSPRPAPRRHRARYLSRPAPAPEMPAGKYAPGALSLTPTSRSGSWICTFHTSDRDRTLNPD
ncbi:hypothetical protein C8Q73DRAFT_365026 [Cubamyces lactineus]|nr:hypothetical protein C8Q73DRAFT_365026 [Cubamyces lactineus]